MELRPLPLGIQDFAEVISGKYLYVDKTQYCHTLITRGKYYFLSRPRRFGKSMLISTLREIFKGNRDLFEGLWIHDKITWQARPVILLDFTQVSKRSADLEEGIRLELSWNAENYGLTLSETTPAGQMVELIRLLSREEKVAILVDEYDKPLIDNIEDPAMVRRNQQVIKDMYSVLKGNDARIAFLMLTGVSRFSHVSIFSDLNNLNDISIDEDYAQMLGYTEQELSTYFDAHIQRLSEKVGSPTPSVMATIKAWYNGYSWDGIHQVYNPFSILNLFTKNDFRDYWFTTGTPSFLVKLLKRGAYSVFDLAEKEISMRAFNKFDIFDIEARSLLFQTGYLTIKRRDTLRQTVTLDFPNLEVSQAFSFHLLAEFAEKGQEATDSLVRRMAEYLHRGEVAAFIASLKSLFAGIAYPIQPAAKLDPEYHEKYYHTMFYLVLRLLGYDAQAEVLSNTGRIDAIVTTAGRIYFIEFKLGRASDALTQIKERKYHLPYLTTGKPITLIGIGFDVQARNVGDYLAEDLP